MENNTEEGIVGEIFIWLPLKSLVAFKALSKRWYYLISHKKSYFRHSYISTMTFRARSRIVGSFDSHPIMLGSYFQNIHNEVTRRPYDVPQYLPTSLGLKRFQQKNWTTTDPNVPTYCFTLDEPVNFLQTQLNPNKEIYLLASSNGILLCSIGKLNSVTYYLVNPITKEWRHLPEANIRDLHTEATLVCKGEYPCISYMEYTIGRVVWPTTSIYRNTLRFEVFFSGDDEWTQFSIHVPGPPFCLHIEARSIVISSSQENEGTIVYFLVLIKKAGTTLRDVLFGLLVLGFNKRKVMNTGDNIYLKHMIEAPGPVLCTFTHLEEIDGVIHFVQCNLEYLSIWVLESDREWLPKHKISLGIERYPWIDPKPSSGNPRLLRVEGFHPLDPTMVLLTIYRKKMWCDLKTETLEFVAAFSMLGQLHFAYQWPCWPPLI